MILVIRVTPYDQKQIFIVVIPRENNLNFIFFQPFGIKILANFIKWARYEIKGNKMNTKSVTNPT